MDATARQQYAPLGGVIATANVAPQPSPALSAGLFLCTAELEAIDGMLCDILAAIARADYEAAAASARLGVAPRPARGGAPLSPVTFSVVAGLFFVPA